MGCRPAAVPLQVPVQGAVQGMQGRIIVPKPCPAWLDEKGSMLTLKGAHSPRLLHMAKKMAAPVKKDVCPVAFVSPQVFNAGNMLL